MPEVPTGGRDDHGPDPGLVNVAGMLGVVGSGEGLCAVKALVQHSLFLRILHFKLLRRRTRYCALRRPTSTFLISSSYRPQLCVSYQSTEWHTDDLCSTKGHPTSNAPHSENILPVLFHTHVVCIVHVLQQTPELPNASFGLTRGMNAPRLHQSKKNLSGEGDSYMTTHLPLPFK
jgi:hypothetical protein